MRISKQIKNNPMVTKLVRVVTYRKDSPPIKSTDPLITWSFELTWQIKRIPFAEDQTKQCADLTWLTLKVTWLSDQRDVSRHRKNYFSTFTRLMATKLGQRADFGEEVQSANAYVVTYFLLLEIILHISVFFLTHLLWQGIYRHVCLKVEMFFLKHPNTSMNCITDQVHMRTHLQWALTDQIPWWY